MSRQTIAALVALAFASGLFSIILVLLMALR
jgi:hypothetical protein